MGCLLRAALSAYQPCYFAFMPRILWAPVEPHRPLLDPLRPLLHPPGPLQGPLLFFKPKAPAESHSQ